MLVTALVTSIAQSHAPVFAQQKQCVLHLGFKVLDTPDKFWVV